MSAPIVVGVDGSASALTAVAWAAGEAARHRAPLELVHAYVLPVHGYPAVVPAGHEVREAFEQQARRWVDQATVTARAAAPEVEVRTSIVVDQPVAALIAVSGGARQVVLGSRGLGGFSGLLVGSVAVAAAAHAECPVVVVRGESREDGPVVVGVDGSPASEEAIGFAFAEASVRGAPLVAVIAWTTYMAEEAYYSRFAVDWARIEEESSQVLAGHLASWQEKYPDVRVERVVRHDRPVRALLDVAADARLLVVGSHGMGGFTGMLLGSVSQALVYHSPCPLAVVRPTPPA